MKGDSTSGRGNGCDGWFPATRTGQLRGLQIHFADHLIAAEFTHGLKCFSVLRVPVISAKTVVIKGGWQVKGYTKFHRSVANRPSAAIASQRLTEFRTPCLFIFVIDCSDFYFPDPGLIVLLGSGTPPVSLRFSLTAAGSVWLGY